MKLIDQMPIPTFVTDSSGRVIYCNAVGKALYEMAKPANQQQRNWNFLELVYTEQKKSIEDMIKRASKEIIEPTEVPILGHETKQQNDPQVPERKCSKVQLGLNSIIVQKGYKYYKIRMERVTWKAANCVMLSCEYIMDYKESFDTILHNSLKLREHLNAISSELEQAVTKNKKEKDIKALIEAKETYYLNENSVLYAMQCLNDVKMENENYSLRDTLGYLLELLSFKAHSNKLLFVLRTEACFPKEVSGDKNKFEMLMIRILLYLIEHVKEGDIKVFASMKCPDQMGFVLSFEITATKNSEINTEVLEKIFSSKDSADDEKILHTYGLHILNCKTLLNILKGNVEISDQDQTKFKLCIELPFANSDTSKEVVVVHKLGLYETERLGEYAIRWLPKKAVRIEAVDNSKPSDFVPIPMSPAPFAADKLSLRREPKGTMAGQKTPMSQDSVKEKMIARLRGGKLQDCQPSDAVQCTILEEVKEGEQTESNFTNEFKKKMADPQANSKLPHTPPSAGDSSRRAGGFYQNQNLTPLDTSQSPLVEASKKGGFENFPENIILPNPAPEQKAQPKHESPPQQQKPIVVIVEPVKPKPLKLAILEEEKTSPAAAPEVKMDLNESINDKDYEYVFVRSQTWIEMQHLITTIASEKMERTTLIRCHPLRHQCPCRFVFCEISHYEY